MNPAPWAYWAYAVGWEPKGWPPENPLVGLPFWLRQALLRLAEADGLPAPSPYRDGWLPANVSRAQLSELALWTQSDYHAVPSLDPMGNDAAHALDRLLGPFLERTVVRADGVQVLGPGHWRFGEKEVTLEAQDAFEGRVPLSMRRTAHDQGFRVRHPGPPWERWLTLGPVALRLWSLAWLARLGEAIAQEQHELRVRIWTAHPLPILGLWDSLELLEATRRLYGHRFRLPRVSVDAPQLSDAAERALSAYLGDPAGSSQRVPLVPLARGRVDRPHVAVGDPADLDAADDAVYWSPDEALAGVRALLQQAGRGLPPDYAIGDPAREVLDFFFGRFFPHPFLKDEQVDAIQRLLKGESVLVLLPTGYGKSAIYQLAALLQPGTALVVAPLISLILDQVAHLEREGITSVGYITGRQASGSREQVMDRLRNGRYRIFYLAPERLQQLRFREEIRGLLSSHRFSFIAVDEAHCASEWGHDFRTAYLQIRHLRQLIEQRGVARVPMLGLTATASPIVRADVLRILGIPRANVVQTRSSDRPELSYSVHFANGREGPAARQAALFRVVTEVAPQILGLGPDGLLERAGEEYRHGTVVFVPFANAHHQAFFRHSAPAVQEYLSEHWQGTVGIYADQAPSHCPRCRSSQYFTVYSDGWCTRCGFRGERAAFQQLAGFNERLLQTQADFIGSRLPVLVSTKGFGMGIDKPNIRLAVHYVMAGSLEAYYQEAGRAGRDGQHAHVALVTVPPAPECAEQHLGEGAFTNLAADQSVPLPCVRKDANGYMRLRCPFGLTDLCDVGQQAYFINLNFPGADKEWQQLTGVYEQARRGRVVDDGGERNTIDKALARLQLLTVVEEFGQDGGGYRVRLNSGWTWESGWSALEDYLRAYELETGSSASALPDLARARMGPADQVTFVKKAGRILIQALYTTVRAMRLFGLQNLYRYATLQNQCRRVYLRRFFDMRLPKDYNCGFCDTCVPSLAFQRERAFVPQELTREQELALQLENLLTSTFDLEAMIAFAAAAIAEGYGAAVGDRMQALLEQRPNDLVVLFLAALTTGLAGMEREAEALTRRAIDVMHRAGWSLTDQLRFVGALGTWLTGLPERLLGEPGGPFEQRYTSRDILLALHTHDRGLAERLGQAWTLRDLVALYEQLRDGLRPGILRRYLEAVDVRRPDTTEPRSPR